MALPCGGRSRLARSASRALYRWVWRNRRLEQLATLLSRKHPHVGDQLLGVIELVRSDFEQARSLALCEAAIEQVADDARGRDFRDAVPTPRHTGSGAPFFAVPAAVSLALFAVVPAAASNAWARLVAPWSDTPRYTFAAVEPLPAKWVVAHGEPYSLTVTLAATTAWKPQRAEAQFGTEPPVAAALKDGRYVFKLPAEIDANWLNVRVGDLRHRIRVEPTLRPELTAVFADVSLPTYLGRPEAQHKDVRGGAVTLVKGSQAQFAATANRELSEARVDGEPRTPKDAVVTSGAVAIDGPRTIEFRWQDRFGLTGKEPFKLAVNGRDDEPPVLSCENLPRLKVLLDTEMLGFKVKASDDFGIKRIGLEWQGIDETVVKTTAHGERILAAGGVDKELLDVPGTFSAKTFGIEPQPVNVRIFAEDYLPGRPRVYSATYTFYVLNAEQHAIWITEQLSKWHRQSLEVRDREIQLYDTNKKLRALAPEELDQAATRRKIETQAAAERANGRWLSSLVVSGEELVRQASRNPEIGVGHLETWAEMLQILKEISGRRMPSVADLLREAAQAKAVAASQTGNKAPAAGALRAAASGRPSEANQKPKPSPTAVPAVVDTESSQNSPDKKGAPPAPKSGGSSPRLSLAQTTVIGKAPTTPPPPAPPASETLDEAVKQQEDLLAEFDKIAEELNRVLANLEGSTLVKRLKAASRLQNSIAGRIGDLVADTFGVSSARVANAPAKRLDEMGGQESKSSQDVSIIMDDLQAYFERRQYVQFKTVLDEMRSLDVVGSLRQLGDDVKKENGVSIAQCEYWSDTLDRWAEDLVDPACNGACPGAKSRGSLPPSIVLEVLQILEAEVNLREETRVTEQARAAQAAEVHAFQALGLSQTQKGLSERVEKVIGRIGNLPDAETQFAYELKLLGMVETVMNEATEILARPETGRPAIAAETEAIELLLRSKRINPKGGGGGGSSPGGGGTGTTQDSAIALLGTGLNEKEVREDHGIAQSTGDSGPSLPEEFRMGLDEYFNRLERGPGGR